MPVRVYSEPHQVRSVCGRDPYVAKHSGRGLPRYMTSIMDDLTYNSGGPPGPLVNFSQKSKTTLTITVQWTKPVGVYTGALLYISPVSISPVPGVTAGGIIVNDPTLLYQFVGLTQNTQYYIYGFAKNLYGYSSVSSLTITTNLAVPGVPAIFNVINKSSTTISVGWTAPSSGGTSTGYNVYISTTNNFAVATKTNVNLVLNYMFTGLTGNTTYYMWVTGYNTAGEGSPESASTNTDPAAPNAPTNVSLAFYNNMLSPQVRVFFTFGTPVPGSYTYLYYSTSSSPVPVPGTTSPYSGIPYNSSPTGYIDITYATLPENTQYWFWLAADTGSFPIDNWSPLSQVVTGTTLMTQYNTPQNVRSTGKTSSPAGLLGIDIAWDVILPGNPSLDVLSYNIYTNIVNNFQSSTFAKNVTIPTTTASLGTLVDFPAGSFTVYIWVTALGYIGMNPTPSEGPASMPALIVIN